MSDAHLSSAGERFGLLIAEMRKLSRNAPAGSGLPPGQKLLSTWQVERLAGTYSDYQRQARYRPALEFFMTDLYGPVDYSQRDADISRVYPMMVKLLTDKAIESLSTALELHTVSMKLDQQMIAVLHDDFGVDTDGDAAQVTPQIYADAYRRCDNYAERQHQIELAVAAGQTLSEAVKMKILYLTVKLAGGPARVAGFGELQSFLERGLSAFRRMRGADRFIAALQTRETHILNAIYADEPTTGWIGDATHGLVPP